VEQGRGIPKKREEDKRIRGKRVESARGECVILTMGKILVCLGIS
jgi:hypothetical protein